MGEERLTNALPTSEVEGKPSLELADGHMAFIVLRRRRRLLRVAIVWS